MPTFLFDCTLLVCKCFFIANSLFRFVCYHIRSFVDSCVGLITKVDIGLLFSTPPSLQILMLGEQNLRTLVAVAHEVAHENDNDGDVVEAEVVEIEAVEYDRKTTRTTTCVECLLTFECGARGRLSAYCTDHTKDRKRARSKQQRDEELVSKTECEQAKVEAEEANERVQRTMREAPLSHEVIKNAVEGAGANTLVRDALLSMLFDAEGQAGVEKVTDKNTREAYFSMSDPSSASRAKEHTVLNELLWGGDDSLLTRRERQMKAYLSLVVKQLLEKVREVSERRFGAWAVYVHQGGVIIRRNIDEKNELPEQPVHVDAHEGELQFHLMLTKGPPTQVLDDDDDRTMDDLTARCGRSLQDLCEDVLTTEYIGARRLMQTREVLTNLVPCGGGTEDLEPGDLTCFVGGLPHRGPKVPPSTTRAVIFVVATLAVSKLAYGYSQIKPVEPELFFACIAMDEERRKEWLHAAIEAAKNWVPYWKESQMKACDAPVMTLLGNLKVKASTQAFSTKSNARITKSCKDWATAICKVMPEWTFSSMGLADALKPFAEVKRSALAGRIK